MAELADATDSIGSLIEKSVRVNALKFGKPCKMAMPSEALKRERVETRQGLPKTRKSHGEGIVQTTNRKGGESHSGK